ncbi:hypothetical protein ABZ801_25050 [Actinomadura sp. NPDC047616]|uniref:hypothetical protein n=1 Tax=Actinomadura sp. NPDC047616 TaxID=3155914 RepID=UPI0033CCF844
MQETEISAIVSLVQQGKTVVSGEASLIVDAVLRATEEHRSATFWVAPEVMNEITSRHWTRERVKAFGLEPVSGEEAGRIKRQFDIDVNGYSNRIECPRCGHIYGMYEFVQQGIEEHGHEFVKGVMSLEGAAVIRVNPVQIPVCPDCRLRIRGEAHAYMHDAYGCNRVE